MKSSDRTEQVLQRAAATIAADPMMLAELLSTAKTELIQQLAAHELDAEGTVAIDQLIATDSETADLWNLCQALPEMETERHDSVLEPLPAPIAAFFDSIAIACREIYAGLAQPVLRAAGTEETQTQTVRLGEVEVTLQSTLLPNGQIECYLIVPASAGWTAEQLAGFAFKYVDRPEPIVFERRDSGSLVAHHLLPPLEPDKVLTIVRQPPPIT